VQAPPAGAKAPTPPDTDPFAAPSLGSSVTSLPRLSALPPEAEAQPVAKAWTRAAVPEPAVAAASPAPAPPATPAAPAPPRQTPAPVLADVPPPEDPAPEGVVDPHGIVPVITRMSAGSLRTGHVALGILSIVLQPDEVVDAVVQGTYQQHVGVAALTNKRLVLVNEHEWSPDVRSILITPELLVQGWQDDRTASLIFIVDGRSITLSLIADRPLAQDMAHRVRARIAQAAGG